MRSAPDPPRSAPRILITTSPHYLCLTTLPHHFCLTTSPHAADYTKQPVFDEGAILSGLSPSLHNEVVRSILAETVGRLPLFSSKLSPEFQMAIFPKLKPVSYEPGQTIFDKGAVSQELLFVLHGEVDVPTFLDVLSAHPLYQRVDGMMMLKPRGAAAVHLVL